MDGHDPAARLLVGLTVGLLLVGCGSPATTPPVATLTPAPLPTAATPAASPVSTATATPTPRPTPTQEPVGGWPTVSRAGIAMTGVVEDSGESDGRLRLLVTMTGLAPGEAVSLSAAGAYDILEWVCGSVPEPCGDLGCGPTTYRTTEGTAKAAAQAIAGADGTVAARVALVAAPPAESCPTDPGSPWVAKHERWEKVSIADPAHGLVLTPDSIDRGFTY